MAEQLHVIPGYKRYAITRGGRVWGDYMNNHLTNLRWGTRKENVQDSIRHGTKARGERNGSARLTEADVVEMRRRWAAGESASLKCLAAEYGIDEHTVFDCVHSNTWKHVPRME